MMIFQSRVRPTCPTKTPPAFRGYGGERSCAEGSLIKATPPKELSDGLPRSLVVGILRLVAVCVGTSLVCVKAHHWHEVTSLHAVASRIRASLIISHYWVIDYLAVLDRPDFLLESTVWGTLDDVSSFITLVWWTWGFLKQSILPICHRRHIGRGQRLSPTPVHSVWEMYLLAH